jgi:hypothetical protein
VRWTLTAIDAPSNDESINLAHQPSIDVSSTAESRVGPSASPVAAYGSLAADRRDDRSSLLR